MRKLVVSLFVVLVALTAVPVASARRVSSDAAGAVVPIPRPPMPLSVAELRAALESARDEATGCLAPGERATVSVVVTPNRGTVVRVRPARSASCIEVAVQRHVVPLQLRVRARVSASLRVARPGATPTPRPPTPGSNAYDEANVHAALDQRRALLVGCAPGSDASAGRMTLRFDVRRDGSLALQFASIPSGVGSPDVLRCLSDVTAAIRVPAPRTTARVTHELELGH